MLPAAALSKFASTLSDQEFQIYIIFNSYSLFYWRCYISSGARQLFSKYLGILGNQFIADEIYEQLSVACITMDLSHQTCHLHLTQPCVYTQCLCVKIAVVCLGTKFLYYTPRLYTGALNVKVSVFNCSSVWTQVESLIDSEVKNLKRVGGILCRFRHAMMFSLTAQSAVG